MKNNKIYWFEGVTEKGVKSLLTDKNSHLVIKSQRSRRVLVILMALGLVLIAMGSYWPTLKTNLNLPNGAELLIYSVTVIFVIIAVVGGYSFLRISVRGIADAPDELLDERQIMIRNTSFRYAYFLMGYIVLGLMLLTVTGPELQLFESSGNNGSYLVIALFFAFSSMPSMVLAWRERDI